MKSFDAIVVGGGPAGLATAIALCQQGFSAAVVDAGRPPIDKACGEGLLPEGSSALQTLGISIPADAGIPFHGIRFLGHGLSVHAAFRGGAGTGLRRLALHRLLIARAEQAGVKLFWDTRQTGLTDTGILCGATQLTGKWIVGADGHNSPIRHAAGLHRIRHERVRYGFRRHFQISPWSEFMEVHWCADCQIYITPTSAAETCVAVLSRNKQLRLPDALLRFPSLKERLAGVAPTSSERGGISLTRTLHSVQRDRVALVGDASGSIDAVTGEGLTLAFQQAIAIGAAIQSGDLTRYERAHRRIVRMPGIMSRLLLMMDQRPRLQTGVLRSLRSCPAVFSGLLAMHAG